MLYSYNLAGSLNRFPDLGVVTNLAWDPAFSSSSLTFSDNSQIGLRNTTSGSAQLLARSITSQTAGYWYCEIESPDTNSQTEVAVGIGSGLANNFTSIAPAGQNEAVYRTNGQIFQASTFVGTFTNWHTAGTVLGLAFDCSTGVITFLRNNSVITTRTITTGQTYYIYGWFDSGQTNRRLRLRRVAEHSYSPPVGASAWL